MPVLISASQGQDQVFPSLLEIYATETQDTDFFLTFPLNISQIIISLSNLLLKLMKSVELSNDTHSVQFMMKVMVWYLVNKSISSSAQYLTLQKHFSYPSLVI
jgi:hypothetical protein